MSDDLHDRVAAVRDHLAATETLPIDPAANRWLGEAHAVAADAADPALPPDVARERMSTVASLLERAGETGDADADDHVVAARRLAARLAAIEDCGHGDECSEKST